jgi:hypothetical protein
MLKLKLKFRKIWFFEKGQTKCSFEDHPASHDTKKDKRKEDIVEDQDEDVSLFNLPIVHLIHHVSISRLYV